METLANILQFIEKSTTKESIRTKLLDESDDLERRLYSLVVSGEVDSDLAASTVLYGGYFDDSRYRTLKYRMLDKAVSALQTYNPKSAHSSRLSVSYFKALRYYVCSSVLAKNAVVSGAQYFAQRCAALSREHSFTELEFQSLRILLNYSSIAREGGSVKSISERLRELQRVMSFELESDLVISSLPIDSFNIDDKLRDRLAFYETSLFTPVEDSDSYQVLIAKYRFGVYLAEIRRDPSRMLEISNLALDYYAEHPEFSNPSRIGEFVVSKAFALIVLGHHSESLETAQLATTLFVPGGYNWFLAHEMLFVVFMLTADFSKAFDLYARLTSSTYFASLFEYQKQIWRLFHSYLYLLHQLDLHPDASFTDKPFRYAHFTNSVYLIAKEKQNQNFMIHVFCLCYSTVHGHYDDVSSRLEHLRVYQHRYIRHSSFARDQLIIRAFTALSNCSFDVSLFRNQYRRLLDELAMPIAVGSPISMNELIPYNVLFDRLLAIIEERGY